MKPQLAPSPTITKARMHTVAACQIAFLVLSSSTASAWDPGDEHKCPAAGRYDNGTYGFSIEIPAGLKGCPNSPVGMSDHGVAFRLGPRSTASIEAYAGYNAPLYQDASEDADSFLNYLKAREKGVKLRSRSETHLDKLEAIRQIIEYEHDGVPMIEDETVALRNEEGTSVGYDYAVSLTTSAAAYAKDVRVLENVLKSWKAMPAGG